MWWQRLIGRKHPQRRDIAEINIWRLQSLFNNFRRILFLNNAVLEDMARMEQALGGEYIFDKAFMETAVRTLSSRVHHVAYNLNALTGNGYIPLYDRYQDIRIILDDILAGSIRSLTGAPVLPLQAVGWELEPLVGINLVCLAELRHHPGCRVADGFIITTEGVQSLIRPILPVGEAERADASATEIRAGIEEQLKMLLGDRQTMRFSVAITRIEGEAELINELGRFALVPDPDGSAVKIIPESSFCGEDSESATESLLKIISASPSPVDSPVSPYVLCLEQIIRTVCANLEQGGKEPVGQLSVFVRSCPPAIISGIIHTRAASSGSLEGLRITANLPDANDAGDTFLLRRTYPFDLIQSTITPRPAGYRFPDGRLATGEAAAISGFMRGSALIDSKMLKRLAETAMTLERMMGSPVAVHWECREEATCCITGLTPMPVILAEISDDDLAREQEEAEILCRTGQMVQSGIAAGRVVHVTDEMRPADFPAGAVAVARTASPQLTPVLQRAAAIITEYGTTTGHLATVARELRLPAIFGLPDALTLLPQGSEVTVDASETTIYRGILEMLLRHGAREMDLTPADPEYRTLRRLLRFIMPLNLIDPEAPNFSPHGCRTFHDIIHFCHEKAVDELAHFQERRPGLGAIRTRRMNLGVPMDIRVLDIGGGMTKSTTIEPGPGEVRSAPLAVFLEGLLDPKAWATELPTLAFRDIISSVPRSMGMLSAPLDSLGENLAIVSHDYMNISLRLGYHFSVIDAHLGVDDSRDYVYFRFAGGLADPERRGRRAQFISKVLDAMEFKVSVKGDLVIGRLKLVDTAALQAAIGILGALTAFSRQRDTGLYSDADTRALFTIFADTFLTDYTGTTSPAIDRHTPNLGQTGNSGQAGAPDNAYSATIIGAEK
ncbi:MAG: PEP-utilizing enzyme [Desulfoprunum sp.]|nr:PEP-utilizing enzyme [Desulfoprunum sp.]